MARQSKHEMASSSPPLSFPLHPEPRRMTILRQQTSSTTSTVSSSLNASQSVTRLNFKRNGKWRLFLLRYRVLQIGGHQLEENVLVDERPKDGGVDGTGDPKRKKREDGYLMMSIRRWSRLWKKWEMYDWEMNIADIEKMKCWLNLRQCLSLGALTDKNSIRPEKLWTWSSRF